MDSREDDLWTRVVGLETKMDTVIKSLAEGSKKEEQQQPTAAKGDFQITSLHNKVDKCMRMILEVTEGLQKTSKFIKQLQSAEKKVEKEEEKVKKEEMTRIHTARFSTAGSTYVILNKQNYTHWMYGMCCTHFTNLKKQAYAFVFT